MRKDKFEEPEEKMKKMVKKGLIIFGAIIVFFIALSSMVWVQTGEVAVVKQFGEVVDVKQAGIHFVVPLITSIQMMSIQTEKYETGASAASKDLQVVSSQLAVNYKLVNNRDSIETVYTKFRMDYQNRMIQPIVQEVVKSITASYTAEQLITRRSEVQTYIQDELSNKLSTYGIQVEQVSIINFDFSPEFNKAIEAKVTAEQDKLREQQLLEKKLIQVQQQIATANATAVSTILAAEADARARVLRAEAEANATIVKGLAEAKAIEAINRELSPLYTRNKYVEQWNGEMPQVLGQNNLLISLTDDEPLMGVTNGTK